MQPSGNSECGIPVVARTDSQDDSNCQLAASTKVCPSNLSYQSALQNTTPELRKAADTRAVITLTFKSFITYQRHYVKNEAEACTRDLKQETELTQSHPSLKTIVGAGAGAVPPNAYPRSYILQNFFQTRIPNSSSLSVKPRSRIREISSDSMDSGRSTCSLAHPRAVG